MLKQSWFSAGNRLGRSPKSLGLALAFAAASGLGSAQTTALSDTQINANVLKALASAPELATEAITTHTSAGVVTLSGTASTEAARVRAENLAANARGVQKVVDELSLGNPASQAQTNTGDPAPGMVLQSDGTYAPAESDPSQPQPQPGQPVRNNPEADQELDRQMEGQQSYPPAQSSPQSQPYPPQGGYPQQQSGYPQPQGNYPQQQGGYPPQSSPQTGSYPQSQPYPQQYPQSGYPPNGYPPYQQQQPYGQPGYPTHGYAAPVDGGQVAGQPVVIPAGTLIRLRINQRLASDHSVPGQSFDGIVINDIVAGGFIAIPRGAAVHGTIVDAKSSGVLKGRGELTLQLNQVTLGGRTYSIASDLWSHNGGDKTIETINKTAGFGAVGALIGAVAGGGAGAAIGAGVGAAAGLGSSAASPRGQVWIPAESVLTFHLTEPASVTTVSEQEMQRLAYGVPAGGNPQMQRRYARPYGYPPPYPPPY